MTKSRIRFRRRLGAGATLPLVLLAAVFACGGCSHPRVAPLIIAHRGASHDAPENTVAAFELAWQRGVDGIEGDFYLTADEQIVCIHDRDTERTADKTLTVAESTLAELRALDAGAWKDARWAGQRIPTLAEVLATVPEDGKIFIEIKCGPEIVNHLKPVIAASGLDNEQIVLISFDEDVIAEVRHRLPQHEANWLTGFEDDEQSGAWRPTVEEAVVTLRRIDASGLSCKAHECVSPAFVGELRAAGFSFHVWTVNDLVTAQWYRELGADSITTDWPELLLMVP